MRSPLAVLSLQTNSAAVAVWQRRDAVRHVDAVRGEVRAVNAADTSDVGTLASRRNYPVAASELMRALGVRSTRFVQLLFATPQISAMHFARFFKACGPLEILSLERLEGLAATGNEAARLALAALGRLRWTKANSNERRASLLRSLVFARASS